MKKKLLPVLLWAGIGGLAAWGFVNRDYLLNLAEKNKVRETVQSQVDSVKKKVAQQLSGDKALPVAAEPVNRIEPVKTVRPQAESIDNASVPAPILEEVKELKTFTENSVLQRLGGVADFVEQDSRDMPVSSRPVDEEPAKTKTASPEPVAKSVSQRESDEILNRQLTVISDLVE